LIRFNKITKFEAVGEAPDRIAIDNRRAEWRIASLCFNGH